MDSMETQSQRRHPEIARLELRFEPIEAYTSFTSCRANVSTPNPYVTVLTPQYLRM